MSDDYTAELYGEIDDRDAWLRDADERIELLENCLRGLCLAIDAFWNDPSRPSIAHMRTQTVQCVEASQKAACAALANMGAPMTTKDDALIEKMACTYFFDNNTARTLDDVIVEEMVKNSIRRRMARALAVARKAILEEAATVADRHRSKIDVNEPLWHDGADWACDRIAEALRALADTEDDAIAKARAEPGK